VSAKLVPASHGADRHVVFFEEAGDQPTHGRVVLDEEDMAGTAGKDVHAVTVSMPDQ
jgi:hypothetical protein